MSEIDWLNRYLEPTQPTSRKTRKDVYDVRVIDGRNMALCISCAVGLGLEHEFVSCRDGDVVVRVPCQGCDQP